MMADDPTQPAGTLAHAVAIESDRPEPFARLSQDPAGLNLTRPPE